MASLTDATVNVNVIVSCAYCGGSHTGICSRIQEIEYFSDGSVKRVVFHRPYFSPNTGSGHPWPPYPTATCIGSTTSTSVGDHVK